VLWDRTTRFYPIVDNDICHARGLHAAEVAAACFRGGAELVQLRVKTSASRVFLALADEVIAAARPHGATVIVNDRADIARMAAAGGVHVGQEDLPPEVARAVLGRGVLGVSTHSAQQVDDALLTSTDYIAVGPVYATDSKATGYSPCGLDLVRYAARHATPIVAIGGITLERAGEVLAAGAAAVAVISDVIAAENVESRVREYVRALAAS
jgi:thiamine-phosphate diphosphorylase